LLLIAVSDTQLNRVVYAGSELLLDDLEILVAGLVHHGLEEFVLPVEYALLLDDSNQLVGLHLENRSEGTSLHPPISASYT